MLSPAKSFAVGTALLVLAATILHLLAPSFRRLRKHMKELASSGYLPPPPTVAEQRRMQRLSRFLTWVFIGRVRVQGYEHLDEVPEGHSYQVTPNHSHYADVFVMPLALGAHSARYMADAAVMGGFGGLLGLLIGPLGAFAANRQVGIKVLNSGQIMVIFPEGWTYLDGKVGIFRRGAVNMARLSAQQCGKPSYMVPTYIKYGTYPPSWILRLPIRWQYALMIAAFPFFRRGATVVFGKPISSADLPADDKVANERLREEVLRLA